MHVRPSHTGKYSKTTSLQFHVKSEFLIQTLKSCIEEYMQHLHEHCECCSILEPRFQNRKKAPWRLIIVFLQVYRRPYCGRLCMHKLLLIKQLRW